MFIGMFVVAVAALLHFAIFALTDGDMGLPSAISLICVAAFVWHNFLEISGLILAYIVFIFIAFLFVKLLNTTAVKDGDKYVPKGLHKD